MRAAAWTASPSPLAARVDARLQGTTGRPVPATEIAPIMEHAVVATEDERFYRHTRPDADRDPGDEGEERRPLPVPFSRA